QPIRDRKRTVPLRFRRRARPDDRQQRRRRPLQLAAMRRSPERLPRGKQQRPQVHRRRLPIEQPIKSVEDVPQQVLFGGRHVSVPPVIQRPHSPAAEAGETLNLEYSRALSRLAWLPFIGAPVAGLLFVPARTKPPRP